MKGVVAILFSALLVGMPFAPAPALAQPVCQKQIEHKAACDSHCGMAGCCVAQPDSRSQNVPAVPSQKTGTQNQISLLAPTFVVLTLPENPADSISFATIFPLTGAGAPLYARHCALLL